VVRRFASYIGLLILIAALPPSTSASDVVFTISPVKLQPEAPRGGVAEIAVNVINENPLKGQAFRIYLTDLTMDKEGKAVFPPPGTNEWSAAPWIELDQEKLELGPLGRGVITGRIKVPRNLKTGGARFAAIMVEAVEPEPKGKIKMIIHKRAAAFIYLTIRNSRQLRRADITELSGTLTPGQGYTFTVLLSNKGNMYIQTTGYLSLVDKNYRRWGQAALADTPKTLFPGVVREFQGLMQRRLPAGEYTARAIFYYGRSRAYKEIPFIVTEEMAGEAGALPLAVKYEPESVNFEAPPHAFRRQVLKYKSHEQTPLELKISITDENDVDAKWSAVPWINVTPGTVRLGPGQARNVTLMLKVPNDARGERFAKVVSTAELQDEEPSAWETPVVVTIPGTLEARGGLTAFEMLAPATDSDSYTAEISFKNLSNARLNLSGEVKVMKMQKFEEVSSVPFEGMAYPDQEVTMKVQLPWDLPADKYIAAATVTGVTFDEKARVQDTRTVEFTIEKASTEPLIEIKEPAKEGGIEDETQ